MRTRPKGTTIEIAQIKADEIAFVACAKDTTHDSLTVMSEASIRASMAHIAAWIAFWVWQVLVAVAFALHTHDFMLMLTHDGAAGMVQADLLSLVISACWIGGSIAFGVCVLTTRRARPT